MPPKPDRDTKKAASHLVAMKHKPLSEKHKAELDKARMPPPPPRASADWSRAVRETMHHDILSEAKDLRKEYARLEKRNEDLEKKLKEVESKMPTMKTGGMVKKTAPHMLHKGEMVVPAEVAHHFSKLMKKK